MCQGGSVSGRAPVSQRFYGRRCDLQLLLFGLVAGSHMHHVPLLHHDGAGGKTMQHRLPLSHIG